MSIKIKMLTISILILLFATFTLKAADVKPPMLTKVSKVKSAKDGEAFVLEGTLKLNPNQNGNYIFQDATGNISAYIDASVSSDFKNFEFLEQKVRVATEYEKATHFDIISIEPKADNNNKTTIASIIKDDKNRGVYMLNGTISNLTKKYKTNRPYYLITDDNKKTIETKFDGSYIGSSKPLNERLLITIEYENEVHLHINKIELIK